MKLVMSIVYENILLVFFVDRNKIKNIKEPGRKDILNQNV